MFERMEIRCSRNFSFRGITVHMFVKDMCVKPLELISIQPNVCPDPITTLRDQEAQQLMDDLWMAGIRPSEGSGSAGSLKATQNHLEDMQKIAFHGLKIVNNIRTTK